MADVVHLRDVRARRAANIVLDAELAQALAELCETLETEENLPQTRLHQNAVLRLRDELVPAMGSGSSALVSVEAMYALARELLDSRAELRTVRGAWEAFQAGRVSRGDYDSDISCVAELAVVDAARETLDCPLTIDTSGGAA